MSRYVVGIDLGTTNSALAFADSTEGADLAPAPVQAFGIPQVVAAGEAGERPVLPSFLYLPTEKEFPPGALDLPWKSKAEGLVGWFAREHGAKVPGRLIGSAKSWLSHPGVDRRGAILPWTAERDVTKLSPLAASTAYLAHLRDAWNARFGKSPADRLGQQDVLLTVPASFDAAARELTVEAARGAGLEHVTLLEEPQAAFYAWLAAQGDSWRSRVKVGDLILVCDVGGGTTDFTLIGVGEENGDLTLNRLAVGEHILLGGDNMDLALAYAVAGNLPGGIDALDPVQRLALTYACRNAKETLFARPEKSAAPVALLGRGSKVIGGSVKTDLSRETLSNVLLEGFFPICAASEHPQRGRRIGLTEIGLPYEAEPAVSRHLARFLSRQAGSLHTGDGPVLPSAVLFNGGVFQAEPLRRRVLELLEHWAGRPVPELPAAHLDLAVALGAAYYGQTRAGKGIRIRGGTSRAYYVGIESATPAVPGVAPPIKALCVVPMGMEEGTETDVPGPEFGLIVGEPAEFRFFGSTVRREDQPGVVLDRWALEELVELDPLEARLPADAGHSAGQAVPVRLHAHVTAVGTLDLSCQATRGAGRWKLEYNVRETEPS
jgi:molecular chaperone DnaK (HSP70)